MKKIIVFILLLLPSVLLAEEVFVSSEPISYRYVVLIENLTTANKNAVNNLISQTKNNSQPSSRFFYIYNSTTTIFKTLDHNAANINPANNATRAIVTIDAKYKSLGDTFVSQGKARLLSCLWNKVWNDTVTKQNNINRMFVTVYEAYYPVDSNTDWNIKVSTGL